MNWQFEVLLCHRSNRVQCHGQFMAITIFEAARGREPVACISD